MRKWRKSTRSSANTDCVEVASDLAALRDSKHPDAVLEFDRDQLARFLAGVRLSRFDN